jgi:hypothetical protein
MKRILVLACAAVLLAAVLPSAADARRAPTAFEKEELSAVAQLPASCGVFFVSTVNPRYASVAFRSARARCVPYASDGVTVFRRVGPYWKYVTAGSSFSCPVPKVPVAVVRDLRITCS